MSAADDFEEWRYRERHGIPHPNQGGPPRGTYAPTGFINTTVRLDPIQATALLEPDGVVWQITTLEA